tara:strand:+ start:2192 stop:3517 length:1326 start_codon:yes stop_codon:yes gene_type:complete
LRKGYRLQVPEYSSSKMTNTVSSSYGEVPNKIAIENKQKEIDEKLEQDKNHDNTLALYTAMYPSKCPQCKSSIIVKGKEKAKFKVDIAPSINFEQSPLLSISGQPYLTVKIWKKLLCINEVNADDASPLRYDLPSRVKMSDNKGKYESDAKTAKKKKKNILKEISNIKNTMNKLIEKGKPKNKKKSIQENTQKSLIINQEKEEHKFLDKLWYDFGFDNYHKRAKIKKEEVFQDNALDRAIKSTKDASNVRLFLELQHKKDNVELEEIKNSTIDSDGPEMMNVKCLAVTPGNTLGIEKIPKPIRIRKLVDDVSDIKTSKKNVPYQNELDELNDRLSELRAELDYWKNQLDDAEQNMTEYVCNTCKMSLEKDCLACRDEYIALHGKAKLYDGGLDKNTREFDPLLKIYPSFPINKSSPDDPKGIPVCNECVTKFGKEKIQKCL